MTNTAPPLENLAPAAWRRAVVEILGSEGETWLRASPPLAPWEGMLAWLCKRYGRHAGLGVGLRVGRAFAREALPAAADEAGFRDADFRFLPWHRKMPAGLQRLGALASRWFAAPVQVHSHPAGVLWQAANCPFAANASTETCTPWVGFLQEALYWLSGGHVFAVQPQPESTPTSVNLLIPLRPLH